MALWEAPGGIQRWMNSLTPCPPCVRIHPDNSCWSAAVSELPSWASLMFLSLTLGPGNCLLFLDWGWPCQKAACYTEYMATSHQHSLVSWRKEKKLSEKTEGNLLAAQRLGLCPLTESLHKWCSQRKKKDRSLCVTWLFSPAKQGGSTSSSFAKIQLWRTTSSKFVLWNESSTTPRLVTTTYGDGSICHQWNQALLDLAYTTVHAEYIQKILLGDTEASASCPDSTKEHEAFNSGGLSVDLGHLTFGWTVNALPLASQSCSCPVCVLGLLHKHLIIENKHLNCVSVS